MSVAQRLLARPLLATGGSIPPQLRASRFVSAALLVVFAVGVGFAQRDLGPVAGFFPTLATIVFVTQFVTAVLLLSQARANRLPAAAILGAGYLFTSVVVVFALLTSPSVLAPAGALGAGAQSPPWFWVIWHGGYPAFVLGYLLFSLRPLRAGSTVDRVIWAAPLVALGLAAVAIAVAVHADAWLPALVSVSGRYRGLVDAGVGPAVFELNLAALAGLTVRRRNAPLDMWLAVAVLASLLDVTLTLFAQTRFTLGWYLARVNGGVAGSAVLVALSFEFVRLLGAERTMREQTEAERREARRLRFLSRAGAILSESFDLDLTVMKLAKHVAGDLGPHCTIVVDGERAGDGGGDAVIGVGDSDIDVARGRADMLRRLGPLAGLASMGVEPLTGPGALVDAPAALRGHRLTIPIRSRDERLGLIVCERDPGGAAYTDAEIAMAEEIASRTSLSIVNTRLYRRERRVAEALQRSMLPPTLPQLAGVVFDAVHEPGNADADIGGDWYDAFELPDGRAVFSIGDVAGRGLTAAIVMGKVRQAIRAFALVDADPTSILRNCDRMLRIDGATMVSAIVGIVDAPAGKLQFANAGHPGPVVVDVRDSAYVVESPRSVALGLIGRDAVLPAEIALQPGQLIVFYTDGLIEAQRDIVAAEAKLREVVQRAHVLGEEHCAEGVRDAMVGEAGRDDIAILAIFVPAARRRTLDVQLPATPDAARLLRHAIRRIAVDAGIAEDRVFALEVAFGEAIANVLEHAYGAAQGDVRVRATTRADALSIEVIDFGRWRTERKEGRGHGLNLMRELTAIDVVRDEHSTSVRFTEPLGS